jgi:hypothetical protein
MRQDLDEVRGAKFDAVDTNPTKGRFISGVLGCDGVLSYPASLCDNGIGLRSAAGDGRVGGFERKPAGHDLQRMPNTAALRVGVAGFEPTTSSSRMKCASKAFGGKVFGATGPVV